MVIKVLDEQCKVTSTSLLLDLDGYLIAHFLSAHGQIDTTQLDRLHNANGLAG